MNIENKLVMQDRWNSVPMPKQDPKKRRHNFKEVAIGYTEEEALREASRCLICPNPQMLKRLPRRHQHSRIHKVNQRKKVRPSDKESERKKQFPSHKLSHLPPKEEQCQKLCTIGKKGDPVE